MPPPGSQSPYDPPGGDTPATPSVPPPPSPPSNPPPLGFHEAPPGYAAFTPHNPGTQFGPLAGFGTRLGAWLVDSILYGLAMAVAAIPGIFLIIRAFDDCSSNFDGEFRCVGDELQVGSLLSGIGLIGIGLLLVGFLYIRALATTGQTWGRKMVGVKVIDERTGEPPGWGKAFGRSLFAWFISAQIFYIGYLWMLWDDRKQTLHDKVAGTHVVTV